MGEVVEMGSVLKKTLKSLCCNNGWSYGVFWCFDQRNSMLLTLEDAYYEQQFAQVIDDMLLQVHMLGEGIIGQVAFTGDHKWIFSDAQYIFQDDLDFHCHFSSGIQTIAVISMGSRGVVQFGSTKKMSESVEFLNQAKRLLQETENCDGRIQLENTLPSLNSETYDLNAMFASIISPENSFNGNLAALFAGSSSELIGNPCSLANRMQSSTFESEVGQGRITPLHIGSSHLCNKLQTADREAQVPSFRKPNTQYQPVFSQSASSVRNSVANTPCVSAWSSDGSILTAFEQPFTTERVIKDSPNVSSTKANALVQNFQGDSMFTSMYSREGLVDMGRTIPVSSEKMMDNQHSARSVLETEGELAEIATSLHRFPDEFKLADFATDLSNSYAVDDLSQLFAPSLDHSVDRMGNTTNNDLLPSIGVNSVSSGMIEGDGDVSIPIKHPSQSMQSSISDAFISDGRQKFVIHGSENDIFDGLGLDFGCGQAGECWEDYVKPVVNGGGHAAISTGMSECITELDVGSTAAPRKGLFSELGIEELLNGASTSSSVTKCSFEDQLSTTKRRKVEISCSNSNQVQLTKLSCSAGSMSLMQPVFNQDTNNLLYKKDVFQKSQVGLWIDDSYSINAENDIVPMKPEKPMKVNRKRARPGESTRPRPKDRQQIQDRLKELRGIIPNSVKCSIDSLLDLTIKHMVFLQSITKNADKLKEPEVPKLIGKENGVVLKDNNTVSHNGGGGATWAFEVGGQAMVCPIIVEDLGPPGQMLIEMLCEDRGFFLEIADVIKGFGLNIWKGVMEVREDKIWARFIVEANRHVTRMDIFWSLVQLLQQTGSTSGSDSTNQPSNAMDEGIPRVDTYQQPMLPAVELQ